MFTPEIIIVLVLALWAHTTDMAELEEQNLFIETGIFEKCIEDLGCFDNGPPFFHPIYRPISLLPFNTLDTKFWLFDQQNFSRKAVLKPNLESLWASSFDPTLQTKFIIHGYTSTLEEGDWKYKMKDALLNFQEYNVIMVDWTDSNGPPYPQAVANARVVGAQIAQLIQFLEEETGIRPDSVHLIGHSLGSHLAGWAGERIQNLGRISGLDPAGPYFQKAEDTVRMDPSDAQFVDVIHTNGGTNFFDGLGILDPIGHLDFYPNGGKQQPGCPSSPINDRSREIPSANGTVPLGLSNSCSHARAPELFLASILNDGPCWFESTDCEDSDTCRNRRKGSKGIRVAEMGFHSRKIPGLKPGHKFYLRTSDRSPYCIQSQRTQMYRNRARPS